MKVIYVASVFDDECLSRYFDGKSVIPYAASKYNTLLFEGIAANGVSTDVLSVIPINRSIYKKIFLPGFTTKTEKIKRRYFSQINFPILKNIFNSIGGFLKTVFAPSGTVVIYDVLVISASMGSLAAAKLRGFKKVGIVTDLPKFQPVAQSSFRLKINDKVVNKADAFIFLTKQMNEEVNKEGKPYIVLEGHVDAGMAIRERNVSSDGIKRVIYAGSIAKIYGIKMLCDAFIKYSKEKEQLHIYGSGDYEDELIKLTKTHSNIFYYGNRPNEEIVEAELGATLLVNPRPTDGEYTKFSFPSKTLEYMVSGTPVLSSRLAGIPDEYEKYIYYFDENNFESIGKKIREILDLPEEELYEKGQSARKFALDEKNNVVQAAKIINFCKQIGE